MVGEQVMQIGKSGVALWRVVARSGAAPGDLEQLSSKIEIGKQCAEIADNWMLYPTVSGLLSF